MGDSYLKQYQNAKNYTVYKMLTIAAIEIVFTDITLQLFVWENVTL